MGNKQAAPTRYLDGLWKLDKDCPSCYNCRQKFSFTRRRHHCRCCGAIFCGDCWGEKVQLPVEYGFIEPEAVCFICLEMFSGKLRGLREQRCLVVTQSLKSKGLAAPPLSKQNIADRNFRVFYAKVAQWRPFSNLTHLQFCTKPDRKQRSASPTSTSSLGGALPSSASASAVPRMSNLEASTANDVAFTVSLDSITNVVFDLHAEGDYVTMETAQEVYRIQCVETVEVASPQQQQQGNGFDDNMSMRSGNTSSTNRRRAITFKVHDGKTNAFYEEVLDAVNAIHARSHALAHPPSSNASFTGSEATRRESLNTSNDSVNVATLGTRASFIRRRQSQLGASKK